jgi:hypothetical protein
MEIERYFEQIVEPTIAESRDRSELTPPQAREVN